MRNSSNKYFECFKKSMVKAEPTCDCSWRCNSGSSITVAEVFEKCVEWIQWAVQQQQFQLHSQQACQGYKGGKGYMARNWELLPIMSMTLANKCTVNVQSAYWKCSLRVCPTARCVITTSGSSISLWFSDNQTAIPSPLITYCKGWKKNSAQRGKLNGLA